MIYGVTHPLTAVANLKSMHTVNFNQLRIQHLPTSLHYLLKRASASTMAYEPVRSNDATMVIASLATPLLNLIANINVTDALNNTLNGNKVNLSLKNVLNGNKLAIGQVVGVYIGGGGIITTIVN